MLSLYLSVAAYLAAVTRCAPTSGQALQWSSNCPVSITAYAGEGPYDCSTLAVPLDYTNQGAGTLDLQLVRVRAVQQPSKGSILFNFGGPGELPAESLLGVTPYFLNSTGGLYDLIAFNPRGTGETINFNCTESLYDVIPLYSPLSTIGNASNTATADVWANAQNIATTCKYLQGDVGELIGTGFGARDLISVVDALGEDGMLRYWGLSYGTTLGQTVAAMFPERIDKIVIDGVQNVQEYYYSLATYQQWTDADASFSAIWSTCVEAGAELCPLAARYNDSQVLEADVWNFTYSLKENPVVITGTNASAVLTYSALKSGFVLVSYNTVYWPFLANLFAYLLAGTTSGPEVYAAYEALSPGGSQAKIVANNDLMGIALLGIQGSDRIVKTDNFTVMEEVQDKVAQISQVLGGVSDITDMPISLWPLQAKGAYNGTFENITTRNPMLIVNNKIDGHTPLISAYNASNIFADSSVLIADGYGHTSLAVQSSCTVAAIAAYFVNGTLPVNGTICPVDVAPYHTAS